MNNNNMNKLGFDMGGGVLLEGATGEGGES